MKRSAFFEKTIILIISNIITGTLTFIFSIILSREIGSKGIGLYHLVMPLYMMFLCITGGGITISISKIAAEKKATGRLMELYRTVRAICIFELAWSLIITLIVVFASSAISTNIISDRRTFYSILAFCPALIIVSISSVYKGVYYGLQKVLQPAFIDIVEKVVRISFMYIAVKAVGTWGIEFSSAAAILSLTCGELASLTLFFLSYRYYVLKNPGHGRSDNSYQLVFNVLKLAVPLALNGILSTIFTTIIAVLIPRRLQAAGIPYEDALSMFGKLQGMALTIAFYPTVVTGSINTLVIPSVSEAVTFKKDYIVNHRINTSLRVAAITAFSSTVIILSIPEKLGEFLYHDAGVGELLKLIAPGIPLIYFLMASFAILNGLGKQTNLLINSTIISICDLILLYVLLGIPSLNIMGYSIDFIATAVLGIIINFYVIKKSANYKLDSYNCLILPILCSIFCFIILKTTLINIGNTPVIIILSYLSFCVVYFPLYRLTRRRTT